MKKTNQAGVRGKRLSPEQVRALGSPERLGIVEAFLRHGELSANDLGRVLDRTPQSLYYHLRILVKAHILAESGKEASGRRWRARYRLVSDSLVGQLDGRRAEDRQSMSLAAGSIFKKADQLQSRALGDGSIEFNGPSRNFFCHQLCARLSRQALQEFNARIEELEAFLVEQSNDRKGEEYSITFSMIPAEGLRSGRKRSSRP